MKDSGHFRNKKYVVGISFLTILFIAITIIIACNWCGFSKNAQQIVALAGIVLAFISILLSYIGLLVTTEVKEDIGIQQFKIKQHEEVAKLMSVVNTSFYNLCFNDGKEKKSEVNANLVGVEMLVRNEKYDFCCFNSCPIYYIGAFPFDKFNDYIYSAYLPASISKSLSSLVRGFTKINKINQKGEYVIVSNPFEKEDNPNRFQENSYSLGYTWNSLHEKVQKIIDTINEWYKLETYTEDVNFVSFCRVVSYSK